MQPNGVISGEKGWNRSGNASMLSRQGEGEESKGRVFTPVGGNMGVTDRMRRISATLESKR